MNDLRNVPAHDDHLDAPKPSGPNLTLIYGLMVFALLAAIVVAALVVLPFYNRR